MSTTEAKTETETDVVELALNTDADLETVLSAWEAATNRLQSTHELLHGEVRRLSDELERKNHELARKNRLADLGQMASHVAHEVRNGLVPITLYLSLLRRHLGTDAGLLDILDKMDAGFTGLEATVNDLLHFTANRDPRLQVFDVKQLLTDVCGSVAPQLNAQHISAEIDAPPAMLLRADREMLRRAMLNLLLNALDAMPEGGDLLVTAIAQCGYIEIEVADSGPGINEADPKKLFEPFYSNKSDGTGLGLAIVFRITEVHGGSVTATNCPEGGAAFTLRIPQRLLEAAA